MENLNNDLRVTRMSPKERKLNLIKKNMAT